MKKSVVAIIILAGAAVICTAMLSYSFLNRNENSNSIQVTGLGRQDFTSDLIVWSGNFSRQAMNLDDAYNQLKNDQQSVRSYLVGKGIPSDSITFSAVDINQQYDYEYDNRGQSVRKFNGYLLTQRVEIESDAVDLVEQISREVTELINQGLTFNSYPPQYYYTRLADLKLEMIAEATRDATERAGRIAENSGSGLGSLKSAQMGVFQIIARNSNEDFSWGGTYNTSSKMKTATITMKLRFGVR
ncbi:SIMPL domain-containing protein [Fulvivirga sedimenti]|uniref:SIMPL domain-containing protein n=1 Tax=Fulvivirga sedimenti TaxID=2879465 RepID=A0A9X1KZM0_9BACT|nr:SIMPL domain-containing protein [Fulvivirga sedimenti]MCA6079023.1 SIMPL domain-containing protein [Fulvivirga sedimenti]